MTAISSVGGTSSAWSAMAARREARQGQMFDKVDSDGSGEVSSTELQGALDDISARSGTEAGNAQDLLGQYDKDGDGSLSQDELGSALKSVLPPPSTMEFAQSRSGDGSDAGGPSATGGHHHGGGGGGGKVEGASSGGGGYDPLDTDHDGTVSAAELAAAGVSSADGSSSSDPLAALFQDVDSDGNGKISDSESDVLMQKIEAALSSISSGGTATASAAGTSDGTDGQQHDPDAPPPPFDLNKLAQMVVQQYEQVAGNGTAGTTVSAVA